MKQTLVSVGLAALVAAGVAFGTVRWASRPAVGSLHDADGLKRALQLTPEQTARVAALVGPWRAAVDEACRQHCAARFELSEQLAQPTVDRAAADAAVRRMCAAANAVEHATLEHILRVREVLTPEQQRRYAALLHQQLCTMYPPPVNP